MKAIPSTECGFLAGRYSPEPQSLCYCPCTIWYSKDWLLVTDKDLHEQICNQVSSKVWVGCNKSGSRYFTFSGLLDHFSARYHINDPYHIGMLAYAQAYAESFSSPMKEQKLNKHLHSCKKSYQQGYHLNYMRTSQQLLVSNNKNAERAPYISEQSS